MLDVRSVLAVLAALPLTSCASAYTAIYDKVHSGPASPGDDSSLRSLDRPALQAVAMAELIGIGNGEKVTRPDPTEAEVHTPVMAHSYADHVFLAEHVFLPILKDETKHRELLKALCAWRLQHEQIAWTKSVGEAIDARKCESEFTKDMLFTEPALKLAMAEQVLEGHPRRSELRNAVILHLAQTLHGKVHRICYPKADQSADSPSELSALEKDLVPAVDGRCTEFWKARYNGYRYQPMQIWAFFFEVRTPEHMRPDELNDAVALLDQGELAAPGGDKIKAERARLTPRIARRTQERDAVIAEHRASNPAVVPQEDVDEQDGRYLWHRLCGAPVPDRRFEDNVWVESQMVCVAVTYEYESGCGETEYAYRRIRGRARWGTYTVGNSKPVACP